MAYIGDKGVNRGGGLLRRIFSRMDMGKKHLSRLRPTLYLFMLVGCELDVFIRGREEGVRKLKKYCLAVPF